ncbi:ABC transporter ATP-binding protein [Gordonia soli]|uniref:Putative ABC transporter ATP-binding protein n=1 Tax=Gordonia soli NBRC 108243 TaxID=1223545 RepID=M0QG08_9ACTN|nr:ATP-binding cassette domain-containing protein [Gordonia soli]GAC67364.1 putative ABC transporter ATP-binding protein [Gordonia soli NBRC 108243]
MSVANGPDRLVRSGIVGVGLTVRLGETTVLSGVDVTVEPGSVTGVVGASGTGKTTLIRAVAGLVPIMSGSIRYDGRARPPTGSLAVLAQHARLVCNPRWTLRRIIAEPASVRRTDGRRGPGRPLAIESIASRVGLAEELLDRRPAQVSDGQLQRACLARTLVQRPDHLLCDEPTAMLDPIAARDVIGLLDEMVDEGVGVLLVTHQRRLLEPRARSIVDLDRTELDSTELESADQVAAEHGCRLPTDQVSSD